MATETISDIEITQLVQLMRKALEGNVKSLPLDHIQELLDDSGKVCIFMREVNELLLRLILCQDYTGCGAYCRTDDNGIIYIIPVKMDDPGATWNSVPAAELDCIHNGRPYIIEGNPKLVGMRGGG